MKLLRQGKELAIAVHDGLSWRAYALRHTQGDWVVVNRTDEVSHHGRQMPKPILEFLAQCGALRLRVLLSGEVHTLATALPEDASEEELHTALAYEVQGELGIDVPNHRLAAARADLYQMGSERKALLAASFELDRLRRFAADAEAEGLTFEGVGSLELAVLAQHARRAPHRRLLLVRERTSFYAVPANGPQPFMVAMLPLGLDPAADAAARERSDRARDRLNLQATLPLTVVLPGEAGPSRERLAPYLGSGTDIEYLGIAETEKAAMPACATGPVGGVDAACPWIGLPPAPRDPHRHGTIILLMVLAATLCWVGWRKHDLDGALQQVRDNRTAWESLENARQRAESETKSLRDRQNGLLARKALLERQVCLPSGLLPTLATMAEHMPAYSSLLSVNPRPEGGLEIVGLTRWQDGLPQLDAALRSNNRTESCCSPGPPAAARPPRYTPLCANFANRAPTTF
jgi:hypothetical protein